MNEVLMKARAKLQALLRGTKYEKQTELAGFLGISPTYASRLLAGLRGFRVEDADKLERLTEAPGLALELLRERPDPRTTKRRRRAGARGAA